jgi:4-amino-4-deoxy-L-arabinose transferase-like glycosyltransferase
VRLLQRDSPRLWLGLGAVLGLGLLNKISVLWLGAGPGAALLFTSHRQRLATRWPWLALGLAALVFAPHILWQIHTGWPTLEFMRNATQFKIAILTRQPQRIKKRGLRHGAPARYCVLPFSPASAPDPTRPAARCCANRRY